MALDSPPTHRDEGPRSLFGRIFSKNDAQSVCVHFPARIVDRVGENRLEWDILCIGSLSPRSAWMDLLTCGLAWAEAHPHRPLRIGWVGEGDIAGVLSAQPLPPGMSQHFFGTLSPDALSETLSRASIAVAADAGDTPPPVALAMASGLPVIGCVRSPSVRWLVKDGVTGWLFDSRRPATLSAAFERAMATPADVIARMRTAARLRISGHPSPSMPAATAPLAEAIP